MTPNVSFALLDTAVIAGKGEEPLVQAAGRTWSHARTLEEVAAIGGVLRHLGVGAGVPCVVQLETDHDTDVDAVVAALAVARIGGVLTTDDDLSAPAVVVSAGSALSAGGRVRLVRGEGVAEPDLDWEVMLRAGRTDPAAAEVLDPAAAYSPSRSVAEEIEVLRSTHPPYAAADLRALLQV
jgi:hypothetical protein